MLKKILALLTENWLMICIIVLATWLRTTELETSAIFFGDAGRDLLAAAQAVEDRQLPLLGIPSSVPRFHQGPLTVWLEMVLFVVAGYQLYWYSLVFALISVMAVIGLYELVTVFGEKRQGQIAAVLLAASPLAVAHGRMVYHITPIPMAMLLYLWSLLRLTQNAKRAIFWSVFAWCFLFQFELAVVPLLLLIPYLVWRCRLRVTKTMIGEGVLGLLVGLAPQIIFDLTHRFAQLGTFVVWVGYRLVSAMSVVGDHALSPTTLQTTLHQLKLYGLRIVSIDQPSVGIVFATLLGLSAWYSWLLWQKGKLPWLIEITWVSLAVLLIGFAVHSSPSEAYFPVFCVILPILISFPLSRLPRQFQPAVWTGLVIWAVWMSFSISRNNWFVGSTTGFSYGPAVAEQRQIVAITRQVTNDSFTFTTVQSALSFASYFDNLRWLALEAGSRESSDGTRVYIEPKNSELSTYPTATRIESETVDMYFYE